MPRYIKLEIFIPEENLPDLRKALQSVDAGHIGKYDSCLSYSRVTGSWRPLEGSNPYLGSVGEVCEEPELKVEVRIDSEKLEETLAVIRKVHPYEEPVVFATPLISIRKVRQITEEEKKNELGKIRQRIRLMNRADRGEKPPCPKCKVGHIISFNGGRSYACDNEQCDYYFFVSLSEE